MLPMKRLRVFFLSVMLAMVFAPLDAGVSGGGVQLSSAYAIDIAHDTGPVCVALPITPGPRGKCPAGQVELPNNQPGGVIIYYLKQVLFLVNTLIGGIIILVLVIAGVQYIISGGDPSNIKSAKGRIINAMTALVLYLMMVAILNFLVPGGIL